MAAHLTSADNTSIASMAPYFCWMSRHLLGCDEGTVVDARLQELAHQAITTFIGMQVKNAEGDPCTRPS